MRNPLIGLLLKSLLKEYESGQCDNLTDTDNEAVNEKLLELKQLLANQQDESLTIEQASIFLNVSRPTIYKYIKEGKLTPKKQLGGVLQFKKKELIKLIQQSRDEKNR